MHCSEYNTQDNVSHCLAHPCERSEHRLMTITDISGLWSTSASKSVLMIDVQIGCDHVLHPAPFIGRHEPCVKYDVAAKKSS